MMKDLKGLICEMLRDFGVKSVMLYVDNAENPTIEFKTDS